MKIKSILEVANNELKNSNIGNYFYESRQLLSFVLEKTKEWIVINLENELTDEEYNKFINLINRRIEGVPLQYILGEQYFMGLRFVVNNNVLIPRADTEILVYKVIELSEKIKNAKILDLCTGSGCIAISLAKELSDSKVFASDISRDALNIAKENSKINETNVEFLESNLFENIPKLQFDVIVSNPPYINKVDMEILEKDVLNEPHLALYGGVDGLDFYRKISENAMDYLKVDGILAFEIGYDQAQSVCNILDELNYKSIEIIKDYSNNDRVVIAQK